MNDAYMESLGKILRARRREAGLSISLLGRIADVDRLTIRHIEQGEGNPSANTQLKLCLALGISFADVVVDCERSLRNTMYDAESAESQRAPESTVKYFLTKL